MMNLIHVQETLALELPVPIDYPRQGPGKRVLSCVCYDRCLTVAADGEWASFNCAGCPYAGPDAESFDPSEYIPKEEELEEMFGRYWQLMIPERLSA